MISCKKISRIYKQVVELRRRYKKALNEYQNDKDHKKLFQYGNKTLNNLDSAIYELKCQLDRFGPGDWLRLIKKNLGIDMEFSNDHGEDYFEFRPTYDLDTPEKVETMCRLITHPHSPITYLNLNSRKLGDAGFKAIIASLQQNPNKLDKLLIGYNQLSDDSMQALTDYLMSPNNKLEVFSLYENQITDNGAIALAEALIQPALKVTYVYLGANQISPKGGATILKIIAKKPSLKISL